MDDKKIIEKIERTLEDKMKKDDKILRYTFYELRIKENLTEKETERFLELIKITLEKKHYDIYFTGAKFTYEEANRTVQPNELLIAIKND